MALIPNPAIIPPNIESMRSSMIMGTKENFVANKNAITLITILKKEAENEDERAEYLRVIRFVKAMQNAPKNTKSIPDIEAELEPKGSAEMRTPKNPRMIAEILIILIFSLRKK